MLSTLSSGGIIGSGSVQNYIADSTRRAIGISLAQFQDGQVQYFSKDWNILKRALKQRTYQLAYGTLRSYPRYIKYWEQRERDKILSTQSNTSLANKNGQYYKLLIEEEKRITADKKYTDTIVGNLVKDYLELSIDPSGTYYDSAKREITSNKNYGSTKFVDLQPMVQVSNKNNVLMTTVQGRDYSRKEFISGGDYEVSISGKITSKYPDIYPEAEVSKFIKLMQYKGIISCDNIILRQFNIDRLVILNYNFPATDCRNVQPYNLNCVAIEPSKAVEVKTAEAEKLDNVIGQTNGWIKLVKFGTQVVDPASLLKISRLWI